MWCRVGSISRRMASAISRSPPEKLCSCVVSEGDASITPRVVSTQIVKRSSYYRACIRRAVDDRIVGECGISLVNAKQLPTGAFQHLTKDNAWRKEQCMTLVLKLSLRTNDYLVRPRVGVAGGVLKCRLRVRR
jgi:hypothetical protein